MLEGDGVGADLDDGSYGRSCDRTSSCGIKHSVTARSHHFDNFGRVAHVGKAPACLTVGDYIHHVETICSGYFAWTDKSIYSATAALGIGTQRFFFDCGQTALGIALRETVVTHLLVIDIRLMDAVVELLTYFFGDATLSKHGFAAYQFAWFLKDAGGAIIDKVVERASHSRIGGDTTARIRASTHCADAEVLPMQFNFWNRLDSRCHCFYGFYALTDGTMGAALLLNDNKRSLTPAFFHHHQQLIAQEVLTT